MPDTDYGSLALSEVSRRAWAVEQAVAVFGGPGNVEDELGRDLSVLATADKFLYYLDTPLRAADDQLLTAARAYDGRQDAGVLIGALADALERMRRGG